MILRPRVPPDARLPSILSSLTANEDHGGTVVFAEVAQSKSSVFVLTQAQSWDPPGRELLKLLKWLAEESGSDGQDRKLFKDSLTGSKIRLPPELQDYIFQLVSLDSHFVVVAPCWSPSELAHLKAVIPPNTDIVADPMSANLPLAQLLGLRTQGGLGMWPAIVSVDAEAHAKSVVIGRANGWYGDCELLQFLGQKRLNGIVAARKEWRESNRIKRGLDRYHNRLPPKYDHPGTDPLPIEILLHILTYLLPEPLLFRTDKARQKEQEQLSGRDKFIKALADQDDTWPRALHACALVSRSFFTTVMALIARHALPNLNSLKATLPQNPDGTPARPLDTAFESKAVALGMEIDGIRNYEPVEVPFARDVKMPMVPLGEIEKKRQVVERWRLGLARWEKDKAA